MATEEVLGQGFMKVQILGVFPKYFDLTMLKAHRHELLIKINL